MNTKQINVYRDGTFENKIASILSEDLRAIGRNGFGYLEIVLRRTLFSETNNIDWEKVADLLANQCPERGEIIGKIKAERGNHWKETL